MSNELIKSMFKDKEIRIVEESDDFWMPIKDIADAIGYDHRVMMRMIDRNTEMFNGFVDVVRVTTHGRTQEMRCLNEQGFYMSLSKISVNSVGNQEIKASIIEFNRHMVSEMKRIRQERSNPSNNPSHGKFFEQECMIMKMINEELGIDKTLLMVTVIERTEHFTGIDMSHYRNMLPAPEGVIAVLRATDIGKELNIDAAVVNLILKDLGLHEKVNKKWSLTRKGEKYGKSFYESKQHDNGGHWSGMINKWSPEVIDMVRSYHQHNS